MIRYFGSLEKIAWITWAILKMPGIEDLIAHSPPRGSLQLDTRAGNHIDNYFDRSPVDDGLLLRCKQWRETHKEAIHDRWNPTAAYNCHGLTFACRRTGISEPSVVREILAQDSYKTVTLQQLMIGDIVIYVDQEGDIAHSGFVVKIDDYGVRIPWVLGKWGDCQEVIHRIGDCPYPNTRKEYYRVIE